MGTRLYPYTTDERKLERLARVSRGTAKLVGLKENLYKVFVEQNKDQEDANVLDYDWHCLFSGSEVAKFESFQLFGWGKFNLDLVPSGQERYSGYTNDRKVMREMLLSSGWQYLEQGPNTPSIDEVIELSDGFYWG